VDLFSQLLSVFGQYGNHPAFYINGKAYTYSDLNKKITQIRVQILNQVNEAETNIGLVANDDLETYASILALWLEGKAYVPLSPKVPEERNAVIIKEAGLKTIIDSSDVPLFPACSTIASTKTDIHDREFIFKHISSNVPAYILFTSGTTGAPKGVPITRANLASFVEAFDALPVMISGNDRWLQMFDLTFDLSVMSFLVPLLKGACVYTIPHDKIKYQYVYKLMEEQKITGGLFVPSVIHYLRPYFEEINCPDMRYCLFCGEALHYDVLKEWSNCIPKAAIMNVYGPTENTIFCTSYLFNRETNNKTVNGILSIGKPMEGNGAIVIDENQQISGSGHKGELCLSGSQLTPGYWNDPQRTETHFFTTEYKGKPTRFYKTGDLCTIDEEGDIYFLGRSDSQVKIQGFRVELSEVEYYVREFMTGRNVFVTSIHNSIGNLEIALAIEDEHSDPKDLLDFLKSKLPPYMIPGCIVFQSKFPYNANGKIDTNALKKAF
jgi:D-alanine--poly(phosphoribitol) ligase subunit 1